MSTAGASSGVAVIDKPSGWTSHQVVGRVRRLAGTRKVGHAGTLDPMATGVLVVGVERATRLLGHLSLTTKAYEATVRLGQATVSDDAEGEVSAAAGAGGLTDQRVEAALAPLRGDIRQVPSAVSAIKVDGVRSYARVRAGDPVTLAARPVRVDRLEVRARRDVDLAGLPVVDLDVLVECSSGTYVRALARDLGAALGTGGHLTALRRTRVGPFELAEAQPLGDPPLEGPGGLRLLGLPEVARRCFATVTLDAQRSADVRYGRRLPGLRLPAEQAALLADSGELLALYRQRGTDAVPEVVFVHGAQGHSAPGAQGRSAPGAQGRSAPGAQGRSAPGG